MSRNESLSPSVNIGQPRRWLGRLLTRYRIWPVMIVLMIGATIASQGIFLRPSNLVAVLLIAAPTAIAAIGETMVIVTAGIDLSVAGTWVLSAVIAASLASSGHSLPVAAGAALGVGAGVGMLNGLLVAVLRVPPLITTLGTLSIGEGVARVYTGNVPIMTVPPSYTALGSAYVGPIPLSVLILITLVLVVNFVMHRMAIGRQIYAVGGNATAARYAGLRVDGTLVFVYVASGILAALAGLIHSAYVQEALTNVDMDALFAVIGGVVVGGTLLTGGRGEVINSVGGILVIVIVENMMNILGISPLLAEGVLGFIVLVAVYLNVGFDFELLRGWVGVNRAPRP